MKFVHSFVFCLLLASTPIGCAPAGPPVPVPIPVSGIITYKGAPLTMGSVSFVPTSDERKGRPANGTIGADGKFSLSTFAPKDGAAPGEYSVVVLCQTGGPDVDHPTAPFVSSIPEKYTSVEKSDLIVAVPAGKKTVEFNFDLVD